MRVARAERTAHPGILGGISMSSAKLSGAQYAQEDAESAYVSLYRSSEGPTRCSIVRDGPARTNYCLVYSRTVSRLLTGPADSRKRPTTRLADDSRSLLSFVLYYIRISNDGNTKMI